MKNSILLLVLSLGLALPTVKAAVIITFAEDPGSFTSSLGDTEVFDFDHLKTGVNKNVIWSGVGSFNQLFIKKSDLYGGAPTDSSPKGSLYSLQGAGVPVISSTLALDEASSYFGMWWSAGDSRNLLQFYLGNDLVGQFTTQSLLNPLPDSYDGNPMNRSLNSSEPYAFINFFGDEKTSWDRIVLTNDGSSGFESDNYTSRVTAWDPLVDGALPGIPVVLVSGNETKVITEKQLEGTRWALGDSPLATPPGAPLPPWSFLAAFAAIAFLRRGVQGRGN